MSEVKKHYWFKSKWMLFVLAIIFTVGLLYQMAIIPRKMVSLNANSIAKIELFQMGERVYITEDVEIQEIVENFSTLTFKRGTVDNFTRRNDLYISFYNLKEQEIIGFSMPSEANISYHGTFFKIISGTLNYAQLISFLPQI
jgi:hypothetical protein